MRGGTDARASGDEEVRTVGRRAQVDGVGTCAADGWALAVGYCGMVVVRCGMCVVLVWLAWGVDSYPAAVVGAG